MSAPLSDDDLIKITIKETRLLGYSVWTWKDLDDVFRLKRFVTSVIAHDGSFDGAIDFATEAAALQEHAKLVRVIKANALERLIKAGVFR